MSLFRIGDHAVISYSKNCEFSGCRVKIVGGLLNRVSDTYPRGYPAYAVIVVKNGVRGVIPEEQLMPVPTAASFASTPWSTVGWVPESVRFITRRLIFNSIIAQPKK